MVTSSPSNVASGRTAPAAPTALSALAISQTEIDLTWLDQSSDESLFSIERSPNGLTGWTEITTVSANVTTYADTGLSGTTTYYYRVRSKRNPSFYSRYSNISQATTTGFDCAVATNLLFHYDFNLLGLPDNTLISAVSDLSPHGWNLSQSNSSNEWTAKVGVQNGLSVARAGTDQFMTIPGLAVLRANLTLHFVVNYDITVASEEILLATASGGGGSLVYGNNSPDQTVNTFLSGSSFGAGFAAQSGWQVLSFVWDNTLHRIRVYRNGSVLGNLDYTHVVDTDDHWSIGGFAAGFPTFSYIGDYGEIICNTDAHNDAQITSTATCLKGKWGI